MNVLAVLVYLAVAASSVLLIKGVAGMRRGPGGPVHDLLEAAFLNGGPARVADTALAAMQADGRLAVGGPGIVAVQQPVGRNHVERAVLLELAAAPSGALHTLRLAVMRNPAVQEIGDGLAARGLMVPPGAGRPWRVRGGWQAAASFVMLPFAMVLTIVQYAGHDGLADAPFPFIVKVLPACLAGLVIGVVCAARASSKVTPAGRRAAWEYRAAHAYSTDVGHRVALGGLRALPDPVFQAQLMAAARLVRTGGRPAGNSGSGSGSSDTYIPPSAVLWCATSGPGSGGSGGGGCGGASGSSCGGSSGCGSSSGGGSSCGGSSGGGSSCGGGGGSSCGGGSSG
ncbi:TIGR04222 domain-containing membrane protein [Streptomyces sp. NPDC054841]